MRRRAFTLVELLFSIGIIVVLVALLLPSLKRIREGARSASCESNVRQITQAMLMYAADNNGTMPTASDVGLQWSASSPGWVAYFYPAGNPGTDIELIHGAFMKYLGNTDVRQSALRCDQADVGTANYSYVLPSQMGDPSAALMRLAQFARPARNIILVEMNGVTSRFDGHFNIGEGGVDGDEPADHHMKTEFAGFGNHGFADGHVETLSRADVDNISNRDRFNYTQ